MHDHLAVTAELFAVGLRPAEDLADEGGDMDGMSGDMVLNTGPTTGSSATLS